MDDRSSVLALLGDDGVCVRINVTPAGRRSLLAEMASMNLMDNAGFSGEMGGSSRGVYGWMRGGTESVFHAEMGPQGPGPVCRGASEAQMGGSAHGGGCGVVTRETWPGRVDMWPVRDTDGVSGNFVVGDNPIGHVPRSKRGHRRSHYVRTSDDYGSFYCKPSPSVSPNRCTDEEAFVSSLRRYPNCAERSKSIDLLQSIAYLQQNVNNNNLQVKTLRYLREKAHEVESELQKLQDKLSRKRINDEPTRESTGPSREFTPKYRETKASFLREHTVFKHKNKLSKLRIKRSLSYENYDYLKTSSQVSRDDAPCDKKIDVRYLTDITSELKKFVDGTDDSMQLCPKLSKRYFDHCRLHHKKSTDQGTLYDGTDNLRANTDEPCTSRSAKSSRPPKICCLCRKPIPCGCKKKRITREEFIVLKINEWIEEIPIYPNETFLEKALRDDLLKKLKSSLVRIPPGSDFHENARKFIAPCVEKLPMWRPDSKAEQDLLQRQVTENLLEKLEGVSAFAIDKQIVDAFDSVKFKLKDSNCMLVNRYDLMKYVTDQLRDMIINRPPDDRAYREQLRSKVADIIAELPIETRPGKKRETLEKLADEITDKVMKIQVKTKSEVTSSDGTKPGSTAPQQMFQQNAENILRSIPGYEGMSESERYMMNQEITRKLQEIRRLSNALEVKDVMREIIADVAKKTAVSIDVEKQAKLAERLTGQITAVADTGSEEKLLWRIIEKMPDLESVRKPEMNKAIKQFAQKIKQIKRSSGENFELTVQEESSKFVETLIKKADKRIKPESVSKIKEKISGEVIEFLHKHFKTPRGSVDSGHVRMISKWLEEIEHFMDVEKGVRDKMATELARKLNQMQKQGYDVSGMMPEEVLKAIKELALESGVEFKQEQEDEIASGLMDKITKVMVETADQENAIWDIIESIPALQDIDQTEHYRAVKNLAMKLQDMKLHGATQADIQRETKSFIDEVAKKTGVKTKNIKVTDIASKLSKKLEIKPGKKTESDRKQWSNVNMSSYPGKGKEEISTVVHSEVTNILDESSVQLDHNTQRELESLLADQVMRGKTGAEVMAEISRFLQEAGHLSIDEAENIAKKLIDNIDNILGMSFGETSQVQERQVDEILNFIDQFSDPTADSAGVKTRKKKLAAELAMKIQEIKADPKISKKEKELKIRDEITKALEAVDLKSDVPVSQLAIKLAKKLDISARSSTPIPGDKNVGLNASVSSSDIALSPITSDTLFVPKRGKKAAKKTMDQLEQVIRDWCTQNQINIPEDKVNNLASEFVEWSRHFNESTEYDTLDEESSQKNHLRQWLLKNTDLAKRDDFPSLIHSLLESLRYIPLPSPSKVKRVDKPAAPQNAAELSDLITKWCDKLPVVAGTSPQDQAKLKALKQNLVSKLMLKIGALNMNPETLNDDFLYESMLSDEIDQLLEEFPQSRELANRKEELKKELMDLVIAAKQNIKEELAGNSYRQQIKDVIRNMFPCVCRSEDIQEKFESLRNNIADAFLHVITAVNGNKNQSTSKFNDEVDKYLSEYTKATGERPNASQLKKHLLSELENIQRPSVAALKSQLEDISVRDEMKSWISQLSLRVNLTAQHEVQINKILSVLGLRLRELERQNQLKIEPNYDKKLQSEITKWLSKLPLQKDVDFRLLSARFAESFKNRVRADIKSIPSSTLNAADREHMDRIRYRSGDEDWIMDRLCPSTSGRPCMTTITEDNCQNNPCRSFSRLTPATSFKFCQNSTQTISCKASQTCVTPQQCLPRLNASFQTSEHYEGMHDQSQCVRSSGGYNQMPCRAPRRYNVTNPCSSTSAYPSNPCNATYDTSCNSYPSCASHGPPCMQGLSPHMKPPSCLMKRMIKDRPRTSVQIEEPMYSGCGRGSEFDAAARYYKESGTTVEVTPRGHLGKSYVQNTGKRQQGSWYDCQRLPELSENICMDQWGPMKCKKRRDFRRRSILSSKGPCKSCAEPIIKCNRVCTRNCPHPSFLYFRN